MPSSGEAFMKKIFLISVLFVSSLFVAAQNEIRFNCDSMSYYSTLPVNLSGSQLKTALHTIIKGHYVLSFPLWQYFDDTDLCNGDTIWDIYSDNCAFILSSDQCGNYTNVCDCYNHEHSFPKSWWGGSENDSIYTDMFHVYPTDGKVNGMRSNYPYGETTSGTHWGNGKLGYCSYPGYAGTVFEPDNQYKGDLARSYFYVATRYENTIGGWTPNPVLNGTSFPCYNQWFIEMLCEWNTLDPVSRKELDRNNAICALQNNRNPFIDHPEWAAEIWPCSTTEVKQQDDLINMTVFPNPVSENLTIRLDDLNRIIDKIEIYTFTASLVMSIDKPSDNQSIDISSFSEGFYTLVIYRGNLVSRKKVVVID